MKKLAPVVIPARPQLAAVSRACDLAEAYAAAYRIALKANCEPGPAHFAALKAMDLASDIYRS